MSYGMQVGHLALKPNSATKLTEYIIITLLILSITLQITVSLRGKTGDSGIICLVIYIYENIYTWSQK